MKPARPVVLMVDAEPGPDGDLRSGSSWRSRVAGEFELSAFDPGGGGFARAFPASARLAAATLWRRASVVHVQASAGEHACRREAGWLRAAKACGAGTVYELGAAAAAQGRSGGGLASVFLRRALRGADVVVVPSEFDADACRRLAPGQSIVALPAAIDCRPYAGIARAVPEPDAPLRLLFIGEVARDQGLYEILQGLRLALVQEISACLVVAGGGPDGAALGRFAASLGIERFVGFCGPVPGEARLALMREADAFVSAAHGYGAPGALMEAMAAGLPAIVTRVGATPELVTDGVHGLFVEPRDPHSIARGIATLAADREALARMGEACRARIASGHSIERQAEEFASLYTDLAAARHPRPAARD
jgi:glycosyltransferase involved in cell wall biosynthesis